jgi:hypothetical protein
MANTYVAIATVTVGSGGATSIDFTSIPQSYTDLVLKISARVNTTGDPSMTLQMNGSTSGYSQRELGAYSTTPYSASRTSEVGITYFYANGSGTTSNTFSNNEIYIPNYTSSNYKSVSVDTATENNSTTDGWLVGLYAGLWSNTAAITSLKITNRAAVNFLQYSTATLYGIRSS